MYQWVHTDINKWLNKLKGEKIDKFHNEEEFQVIHGLGHSSVVKCFPTMQALGPSSVLKKERKLFQINYVDIPP
jgi:hypothetical protein